MKNLVLLFFAFQLFSCALFSQESAYISAMEEAITQLDQSQTEDALQISANRFLRIAKRMPSEWLPNYYISLAYARMSFRSKEKADAYADEAQVHLDLASKLVTEDRDLAEIKTLQGLIHTAKLVVDPMSRGQLYVALSGKAYQDALSLDAENPRARYLKIQGDIGAAQFFKEDYSASVTEAKKLYEKWDAFKPTSSIHPNWGKKKLQMIIRVPNPPTKNPPKEQIESASKEQVKSVAKEQAIAPNQDGRFILNLHITHLKNDLGHVLINLKNDQGKVVHQTMADIKDKTATVAIPGLSAGQYGVQYYHDEDDDKKLATGMFGIPSEGYGYSNDARGKMGPPKFKSTLFELKGDMTMTMKTKNH